jgi:raffinose/stachyose/melibiose transport system permease protein
LATDIARSLRRRIPAGGAYVVLGLFAAAVVYPIGLLLINSLKSTQEIFTDPNGFPPVLRFDNFIKAWQQADFSTYYLNSVIVTVGSVGLILLVGSLACYALARHRFRWTDPIYLFFVLGLMMPVRLAILPLFIMLRDLHLLDNLLGLILVYTAAGLPFSVFLLTNFFRGLPVELDEAARLDGASEFDVYRRIVLPLSKPGLAVVAIYNAVIVWNDYFFPLIFIRSPQLRTLPLGITSFFGEHATQWDLVFAALTTTALPMILAFVLLSRGFMRGLTEGALK